MCSCACPEAIVCQPDISSKSSKMLPCMCAPLWFAWEPAWRMIQLLLAFHVQPPSSFNVQNRVVEVKWVIGFPIIDVGDGMLGKHVQDCLDLVGIQRCVGSVQKSEPRRCE